jgi:hypothetical protein
MSNCLFVAWRSSEEQDTRWGPVGRLDSHDGFFRFMYTKGAQTLPGFFPFTGMPDLEQVYESTALFPIFANRMLPPKRPEYKDYLTWSGFNPATPPDPLTLLGVTEGRRITDMVELFPYPVPDAGRYRRMFFLHGVPLMSIGVLSELWVGRGLQIMPDVSNWKERHTVVGRTSLHGDRLIEIGHLPRYLARDMADLLQFVEYGDIQLKIERVNRGAPLQQLLLCSVDAPWPASFQPCGGDEFQPIASLMEPAAH